MSPGGIVAVSGWRSWTGRAHIVQHLQATRDMGYHHWRVGCANGVDAFAREWLEDNELSWTLYKADWDKYGRAAGPRRNMAILSGINADDGYPYRLADLLVAFPEPGLSEWTSGTAHCIKVAVRLGIGVWIPQAGGRIQ